ncbi:hypothetical protein ACOMHN_046984 [Nucella lapillus]
MKLSSLTLFFQPLGHVTNDTVLLAVTVTQALSLVAEVSSGGVKGSVTFTQVSPDDPVTVTFSLSGPKMAEAVAWQLHTFRVDYDVSDRCVLTRLGPR